MGVIAKGSSDHEYAIAESQFNEAYLALRDLTAEVEKLKTKVKEQRIVILKCHEAAFSDSYDERDIDAQWLQYTILRLTKPERDE
jgi:hypothetical protein